MHHVCVTRFMALGHANLVARSSTREKPRPSHPVPLLLSLSRLFEAKKGLLGRQALIFLMVSRIRSFIFLCRLEEEEEDRSLPRENLQGGIFLKANLSEMGGNLFRLDDRSLE